MCKFLSMKIACLGWGSLIWDKSRELSIVDDEWFPDGPRMPLEFARISWIPEIEGGRRLTLVIRPHSDVSRTLYAISSKGSLVGAVSDLMLREGTTDLQNIGYYNFDNKKQSIRRCEHQIKAELLEWNQSKDFNAVVWTDLGPNFYSKLEKPLSLENIRKFLKSLPRNEFRSARDYILNTPSQIQTSLRSGLEDILRELE